MAISGHPDISCFLLVGRAAKELFLSAGLGADCILTRGWRIFLTRLL
jgi:hypothetical protein